MLLTAELSLQPEIYYLIDDVFNQFLESLLSLLQTLLPPSFQGFYITLQLSSETVPTQLPQLLADSFGYSFEIILFVKCY